MARNLAELGAKLVTEIEAAWARPQEAWARRRLLVVRLIAQHELTVAQLARVAEVSRPTVRGAVAQEFIVRLEAGKFRQARDAQAWIKKRTRRQLTESAVRQLLGRVGGKLKVPRKSHAKKIRSKPRRFRRSCPPG